ncbi:BglG family transcription antiterminator [Gracilibacillus sp. YIM 98692]|uniref:BglG family transcription antiterminator n=1 Tax=Gracilibacillus sp. YIM 98692 TaxID=2663532 RepID=UPI0013D640D4|nr:BglG family transcription antiterminator [Gracilibacillus sp. YIM 98692]
MNLPTFTHRQKLVIELLFHADRLISYQELAEELNVSKRTIQREMNQLKKQLKPFYIKMKSKAGAGIELVGNTNDKQQLQQYLNQQKMKSHYSITDRRDGITYDLIVSKEPIKQYALSKQYDVTEATIATDLEFIDKKLRKDEIILFKRPGIGIYVKASEQQRRHYLSKLLHKDVPFEEWLQLFHGVNKEDGASSLMDNMIYTRLLKIASNNDINTIERIVRQTLQQHTNIELSDKNYVNLIVHILLTVERVKAGNFVEDNSLSFSLQEDLVFYQLADHIVESLEEQFDIPIPKIEKEYIALHLAGARVSKSNLVTTSNEELTWIELTDLFINETERHLQSSLQGDEVLREGLIAHFASAFNRLKYGLQIHNPMIDRIKTKYQDVFKSCSNACAFLEKRLNINIPESEVGYLTMHVGASKLREEEEMVQHYHVLVVCASGFGTSTYLASNIKKAMPQLIVKEIVSLHQLQSMPENSLDVDFIISTISLSEEVSSLKVVVVSPFLTEEDKENIKKHMVQLEKNTYPKTNTKSSVNILARYGAAMVEILDHLYITPVTATKNVGLSDFVNLVGNHALVCNKDLLIDDLSFREKLGGFVLDGVAMIHAKTDGVKGLFAGVFCLEKPTNWVDDTGQDQFIQTALILATPKDVTTEYKKMISEISASLADEEFIQVLHSRKDPLIREVIESILSTAYEKRAREVMKGYQT